MGLLVSELKWAVYDDSRGEREAIVAPAPRSLATHPVLALLGLADSVLTRYLFKTIPIHPEKHYFPIQYILDVPNGVHHAT